MLGFSGPYTKVYRRLDEIDALVAQGLLGGEPPNAADFQIAPNLALMLRFEDLEPLFSGRPSVPLAHRLAPRFPCTQAVALRGTLPASDHDHAP